MNNLVYHLERQSYLDDSSGFNAHDETSARRVEGDPAQIEHTLRQLFGDVNIIACKAGSLPAVDPCDVGKLIEKSEGKQSTEVSLAVLRLVRAPMRPLSNEELAKWGCRDGYAYEFMVVMDDPDKGTWPALMLFISAANSMRVVCQIKDRTNQGPSRFVRFHFSVWRAQRVAARIMNHMGYRELLQIMYGDVDAAAAYSKQQSWIREQNPDEEGPVNPYRPC